MAISKLKQESLNLNLKLSLNSQNQIIITDMNIIYLLTHQERLAESKTKTSKLSALSNMILIMVNLSFLSNLLKSFNTHSNLRVAFFLYISTSGRAQTFLISILFLIE